jgi:predicted branched-subunit amino acid permease
LKTSRILKWVTGGLEALLGIPIIGGSIVIGFLWTPLLFMLILHIVALVFSAKENEKRHGNILGIVTSCLAWIPFLGMVMHIVTAIVLMIDAAKNEAVVYSDKDQF